MATTRNDFKLAEDIVFGQRVLLETTPEADMKQATDYYIGGFCIAFRRRRFPLAKYGEISIRHTRKNGAKTEFQKILDGESKAHIFIFEFTDAWIVCSSLTINAALRSDTGYIGKWNNDSETKAYYIPIDKIPHVKFNK